MQRHFRHQFRVYALLLLFISPSSFAQSQSVLDSLNLAYKQAQHDTSKIKVLFALADAYRSYQPDTAIIIAKNALARSEVIQFERGKALAYSRIGFGYYAQEKYNDAIVFYQNALISFETLKDTIGLSDVFCMMGDLYFSQNNYPLAIEYYQKSQKFADSNTQAAILNSIGIIYFYQKNYALSLDYTLNSLKLYEEIGSKSNIAKLSMNIGVCYYEQGNYDRSLEYLQKSMALYEHLEDQSGIAGVLLCLGELFIRQKQYVLALENLERSLKMVEGEEGKKEKQITLYSLKNIAEIYHTQKKYEKSIPYAQKSVKLAQELKDLVEISITSKTLYEAYKGNGDYANALNYLEHHKFIEDSLFSVGKTKALANLEAKAEIEKQQVEIEKQKEAKEFQQYIIFLVLVGFLMVSFFAFMLFNSMQTEKRAKEEIQHQKEEIDQQNKVLAKQSQELEMANQAKAKLFAIIGHDLRGPISNLKGIFTLLSTGDLTKDEFDRISTVLLDGVNKTVFTLNNLLFWANSQMNGIEPMPETILVRQLAQENVDFLHHIATDKGIILRNEISDEVKVWADSNQINLVVRNLMSNALKFTGEGGCITLFAHQDASTWKISIQDTGMGIAKEKLDVLFKKNGVSSTIGTKGEKGTGLGLMLCQEMIEKNNGKIGLDSQKGKGTTFWFSLPNA